MVVHIDTILPAGDREKPFSNGSEGVVSRSGEGCGFKLWCKLGLSKPRKPAKKSAARAGLQRESPAPALRAGYPAPQAPGGLALLSVVLTQGEGGCHPPWGDSHRHVVVHKMLSSFRNGGVLRVCGASESGTGCAPPQHTQGAHTLRAQAIPTTWAAWRRCAKSYGLRHVVVHMRCFRLFEFCARTAPGVGSHSKGKVVATRLIPQGEASKNANKICSQSFQVG